MEISTLTLSQASLGSLISSGRIVLRNRDECCNENRIENRFGRGFEIKCVFESRFKGRFERVDPSVYSSVSTLRARMLCQSSEIS